MSSARIVVGGVAYELEIESFTRACRGSYWDPPEPGEVELADEVVFAGGTITLEQLIELIAKERGVSNERAAEILFETAYEQEEARRDDALADIEEYERRDNE